MLAVGGSEGGAGGGEGEAEGNEGGAGDGGGGTGGGEGGACSGVVGGGDGEGDGEDSPSRLREEKVGISGLPRDMTRRRPVDGDGERRWWSGRGGRGGDEAGGTFTSALAREAY